MANGGSLADIVVRLRAGVDQFKSGMKEADDTIGRMRINLGRLNALGGQGISVYSNFGITMGELAQIGGLFVLVSQMTKLVQLGLGFNVQLEQMTLGIKAVVAANSRVVDATGRQVEGMEKLEVIGGAVREQIEKMKTDALLTVATLQQLVEAFQGALAPATAAGLSLDETRKIVLAIVQAAGAIGLPMQQVAIEVREILSGTINTHTRLAKALNISNDMVRSWKSQNDLSGQLLKRMEAFTLTGKEAGDTWAGVTSSLRDFTEQLSGRALQPATEFLKRSLISLRDNLGEVKNGVFVFREEVAKSVDAVGRFGEGVVRAGMNVIQTLALVTTKTAEFVGWLNQLSGGWGMTALQIIAFVAAGNLALGLLVKIGPILLSIVKVLYSLTGAARLLQIAMAAMFSIGAFGGWAAVLLGGLAAITGAVAIAAAGWLAWKFLTRDTRSELEKLAATAAKTTTEAIRQKDAAAGAVVTGKALLDIIRDQGTSELDLKQAIVAASGTFPELLKFIGQEKVDRMGLLATTEQLVAVKEREAQVAREQSIAAMVDEGRQAGIRVQQMREEIQQREALLAIMLEQESGSPGKKGIKDARVAIEQEVVGLKKDLVKLETQLADLAKKADQAALGDAKILAAKKELGEKEKKLKAEVEEGKRKEETAVKVRAIAEEEEKLQQLKARGAISEETFIRRNAELREERTTIEIEALNIELKATLERYEKEKMSADDVAKARQKFATQIGDKEAELRREKLKAETELLVQTMKLEEEASKHRLQLRLGEVDVAKANLQALKTTESINEQQFLQQRLQLDRQEFKVKIEQLNEEIKLKGQTKEGRDAAREKEKEISKQKVLEINTEAAMEAAKAKERSERIKRGTEDQERALDTELAMVEAAAKAGTLVEAVALQRRQQLEAEKVRAKIQGIEEELRFAKAGTEQETKLQHELAGLRATLDQQAIKGQVELNEAIKKASQEQLQMSQEQFDRQLDLRRAEAEAAVKLGLMSRERLALIDAELERRRVQGHLDGIKKVLDADLEAKARSLAAQSGGRAVEQLERELSFREKILEAAEALAGTTQRIVALGSASEKVAQANAEDAARAAARVRFEQEGVNLLRQQLGAAQDLVRVRAELDRNRERDRRLTELLASGEADLRKVQLASLFALVEAARQAAMTKVGIAKKEAEERLKIAEDLLEKELKLEKARRTAALEGLSNVERLLLARELNVDLLKLDKALEKLPVTQRAALVERIREQPTTPEIEGRLAEEEQAQREAEIAKQQAGLRAGGTLPRGELPELIKAIQTLGSQLESGKLIGSLRQAIISSLTQTPFEVADQFSKQMVATGAFKGMRENAMAELNAIVEASQQMFDKIQQQGREFTKVFTVGKLGEIIGDTAYNVIVKRLEEEAARY